jgi:chemotaxis protein CheC
MRLDRDALGTFYEMAREGAGLAGDRLTRMRGMDTRVGVTRVHFTDLDALRTELDDGIEKVGVRVPLSGGVEGLSMVLFDADSARTVVDALLAEIGADDDLQNSAVEEVCQIMNAGFIDGWADVLDTAIDMEPPTFVAGRSADAFVGPEDLPDETGLAVLFGSEVGTVGSSVGFEHYLIPTRESAARLFGASGGDDGSGTFEYEKLAGFDRMAQQGADTVADHLTKMTGIGMDVEVRRVNFVALDAIPEQVPNERHVSVAFRTGGALSGYLLFLFGHESARTLVETALGSAAPEAGLGDLGVDAVKEHANIMASGLLDGWANLLGSTIDHSTPAFADDMGAATVDPLIVGLGDAQQFAFVFDTHIEATDDAFDVSIYAIPNEDDLEAVLSAIDPRRVDQTPTTADLDVGSVDDGELEELDDIEGVNL